MQQQQQKHGPSLLIRLAPQDAELLRAAVPDGKANIDRLGIKCPSTLAQIALGAVARTILRDGYLPTPLGAEWRPAGLTDQGPLPPGVIMVQLA